jgi:hypothetical protein
MNNRPIGENSPNLVSLLEYQARLRISLECHPKKDLAKISRKLRLVSFVTRNIEEKLPNVPKIAQFFSPYLLHLFLPKYFIKKYIDELMMNAILPR